jgi:hypothetical protein
MQTLSLSTHRPCRREKALATGSEFLGEGVLFSIAVLATGWEYKVSNDKAAAAKREQAEREVRSHLCFLLV